MSLGSISAATDDINHGRNANVDDLTAWTVLALVNIRSGLGSGTQTIWAKQRNGAGGATGYRICNARTTGQIQCNVGFTTTEAHHRSANSAGNILTADTWHIVGFTFDGTDTACFLGDRDNPIAETAYDGNETSGSGSQRSDASWDILVGNVTAFSIAWQGDIAWVGHWNRVLTIGQMISQQYHPRRTSGCVQFTHYGYNGLVSALDLSGEGLHGTITGCAVTDHPPIRSAYRRRVDAGRSTAGGSGPTVPIFDHHYRSRRVA